MPGRSRGHRRPAEADRSFLLMGLSVRPVLVGGPSCREGSAQSAACGVAARSKGVAAAGLVLYSPKGCEGGPGDCRAVWQLFSARCAPGPSP